MRSITRSVIDKDLPVPRKITRAIRNSVLQHSHRFRGSIRIACGRFYTDEEYEAKRKRVLSKRLP